MEIDDAIATIERLLQGMDDGQRLLQLKDLDLLGTDATLAASDTHQRLSADAAGRAADIEATVAEINDWWLAVATDDAKVTAPKAVEYGASDIGIMGASMQTLFPNSAAMPPEERERVGREMAIAFYVLGKVSRLFGAYQQGKIPGDDSWFDICVYGMMARRIRETGRWV